VRIPARALFGSQAPFDHILADQQRDEGDGRPKSEDDVGLTLDVLGNKKADNSVHERHHHGEKEDGLAAHALAASTGGTIAHDRAGPTLSRGSAATNPAAHIIPIPAASPHVGYRRRVDAEAA